MLLFGVGLKQQMCDLVPCISGGGVGPFHHEFYQACRVVALL
jgi:hypothetical protein